MKKTYNKIFLGMSLVTAMLLGSSAYAGKIIGVDAGTPYIDTTPFPTQYSFGGWNFDNVNVKIVDVLPDFADNGGEFNTLTGVYDAMTYGESFESEIKSRDGKNIVMGLLHGKNWPVGEPAGIKIINNDTGTAKSGKSPNCIMTTSYLDTEGVPVPTVCSSPFQSHKRFKINMTEDSIADYNPTTGYGNPIDLVFNLAEDTDATPRRYQVFHKINNYTGMRLDGYKIEVLDGNNLSTNVNIYFSLDISTKTSDDGDESGDISKFSHGLWGPADKHFDTDGFFDNVRAGFTQVGNNTNVLTGGPTTLGSSYKDLFGLWLPSKWAPRGIFFDDDNDPTTDAALVAFWGDPDGNGVNEWHYGYGDYSFPIVKPEVLLAWLIDPAYSIGDTIEDTLNLALDYVVVVGDNSKIGKTFTIRITPRVAPQAAQDIVPSYIDGNDDYIEPPTDYNSNIGSIAIIPSPTFVPGETLTVAVADTDLNDENKIDTTTIVVKNNTGDEEDVLLTETDVNSSIFKGTLPTDTINVGGINDGTMTVVDGTIVTAYYTDASEANAIRTASTTASTFTTSPTDDDNNPSSGGGGGCTYNPNSKNFDITFLLIMGLGLLYPFRRRFLK